MIGVTSFQFNSVKMLWRNCNCLELKQNVVLIDANFYIMNFFLY